MSLKHIDGVLFFIFQSVLRKVSLKHVHTEQRCERLLLVRIFFCSLPAVVFPIFLLDLFIYYQSRLNF